MKLGFPELQTLLELADVLLLFHHSPSLHLLPDTLMDHSTLTLSMYLKIKINIFLNAASSSTNDGFNLTHEMKIRHCRATWQSGVAGDLMMEELAWCL